MNYQPTNPELLNLGLELLESNKIQGIQCFLSDDKKSLTAEIQMPDRIQKIAARSRILLDDVNQQLANLESSLLEEIRVYFLVEEIEKKAKKLAKLKI